MSRFKPFLDIREKAEILICIAVMVIGSPICYMLGERAAQEDFKTIHKIEVEAAK